MEFREYINPIILYKDDIPSTDYGIKIYSSNILSSPSKNIEFIDIEGRKNGSLSIDKGYEDFTLILECALVSEMDESMSDLARRAKKYLLSGTNCKLYTSEDTEFYLIGTYSSDIDIEEAIENFGLFQAQFRCKPYRFSNDETSIEITEQNTVINNQYYETSPVIDIDGSGDITLKINSQELILKNIEDSITIDCNKMNAEKVSSLGTLVNQNQKMYSDFPVLEEGENIISWTLGTDATLTKLIISFRQAVI